MFGRRKKDHDETAAEAAETETEVTDAPHEDDEQASGPAPYDRSQGPWDASEREIPEDDPTFVDVGALIVQGRVGLDLQIPTDPETGVATSVVALAEESAVELRAFAAPRGGGLWDEIRPEIIAEVERVGGKVEEVDSTFGRELRVVVPVQASDGRQGVQPSRIIGVDGPRWLLRATFMGEAGLHVGPREHPRASRSRRRRGARLDPDAAARADSRRRAGRRRPCRAADDEI